MRKSATCQLLSTTCPLCTLWGASGAYHTETFWSGMGGYMEGPVQQLKGLLGVSDMNVRQLLTQGVNLGGHQPSPPAAVPRDVATLEAIPSHCWLIWCLYTACVTCAGLIVTTALMVWKGLVLLTASESPVGSHAAMLAYSDFRCSGDLSCLYLCQAWRSCLARHGWLAPEGNQGIMAWLAWLQVVVVLSGSMEPAFYRGDILFLNMGRAPFRWVMQAAGVGCAPPSC